MEANTSLVRHQGEFLKEEMQTSAISLKHCREPNKTSNFSIRIQFFVSEPKKRKKGKMCLPSRCGTKRKKGETITMEKDKPKRLLDRRAESPLKAASMSSSRARTRVSRSAVR